MYHAATIKKDLSRCAVAVGGGERAFRLRDPRGRPTRQGRKLSAEIRQADLQLMEIRQADLQPMVVSYGLGDARIIGGGGIVFLPVNNGGEMVNQSSAEAENEIWSG